MMKCFNRSSLCGVIMIMLLGITFEMVAQKVSNKNLESMFYDYTIVTIDSRIVHQTSRTNHFFQIDIPKSKDNEFWKVELHNSGLISEDYISQYTSETGVKTGQKTTAVPTKGHVAGNLNTSVSLTFNDNFIYGYVKDKTGYNYIEPLSYYDKSQRGQDLYVVYNEKDLKPDAPHSCGTTEMHDYSDKLSNQKGNAADTRVDECYEVDYAIANDFLMFQEFGSIAATENHAIGVTNNVQTNFDDDFADELQLIIVTQFTATSAATDPWTSSTDAGTLLSSFRNWGPSGFPAVHDVASLWTDRNFDGSTIGIAYVNVVCTGNRYNCLQNFTTNPQTKRVLVSHELGHNFSAGHDSPGSGTIMAPAVNNTNLWSTSSVNSINAHIASRWCLADCPGSSAPPTASFNFNVIEECTPGLVQFINTSTGSGTLNYEWNFPGGTPAFSTQENPFVTYDNPGSFNVTLTVSNTAGSDVETQNGVIDILASPVPIFSYAVNGTIVSFFNLSQNATSYFWDFGDGSTTSNSDPVHDFLDDGVYLVQLTASSLCGDVTTEQVIVIANPPTADFDADIQSGCADLIVHYTSNSSNNTDDFLWTFEGGNPAISSEENPTVVYSEAGTYDVTLTVINETGDDVLAFTDFIEVSDVPTADFSYVINENEVTFTNFSSLGESYIWEFGDGNSSTEENPFHTYVDDGDYTVILTAINDCGQHSVTSTITISLEPVAAFETIQDPTDCATFVVNFESTSTNDPDTFQWTFEGGEPETSTLANPTVIYAEAGQFDVTLIVTNENGSDTMTMIDFVTVLDEPISAFSYSENGLEVSFIDGSEDAETYNWDFGDGNSSNEVNPVHVYAAEGIYTIELTVTNECGTSTSLQSLNNYTPVSADFSSNMTSGCANLVIEFDNQSSSNVTDWFWTFEGGEPATSTEENPVVTYTNAGQFDVVLTVSHPESSETITLTNYIAVSDEPITSFDYMKDILDVDFTNTTIEGISYTWDFGDGNTSNEENPSHTYESEGEYEVMLTATNPCGTTSSIQTLIINALPTAGIDAETYAGCGPLTVQFNDESSSNVIEWLWKFEGGNPATSTDQNPLVEYATAGTFKVELTVTSPAGSDTLIMDDFIQVLGLPTAEIDFNLAGNVITANNAGSPASSVTWIVDGIEITEEQLNYTFPENGTYIVELIAENECGSDTKTVVINIDVYPVASMSGLPITVCVGDEVQLNDDSSNAEEKLWTIYGGSPGTSTESNPIVTYDSEGIFSITLMVSNAYGQSTQNFIDVVNVIGLPSVIFTGEQTDNVVNFASTATNTSAYLWDFGDGSTSTDINPIHTFETNGTFEVKLTVSNDCGAYEATETFTINSNSVTEAELANVKIFPNPAQTMLNIQLKNSESDWIKMDVLDISGKLIQSVSFNASTYMLDVSNLTAGTYLVRLRSEEASYYKKIAVIK